MFFAHHDWEMEILDHKEVVVPLPPEIIRSEQRGRLNTLKVQEVSFKSTRSKVDQTKIDPVNEQ